MYYVIFQRKHSIMLMSQQSPITHTNLHKRAWKFFVPSMSFTLAPIQHYSDDIMGVMSSPNISLTIVCSTVYSGAVQRLHQSSASLVFVRGFQPWLVNSPHKCPVTQKMFPIDDVIMKLSIGHSHTGLGQTKFISPSDILIHFDNQVRNIKIWNWLV